MEREIEDPVTGIQHCLKHLKPFKQTYEIKVKNEPVSVTLHVHFSAHCYTRSKGEHDSESAVMYNEEKRHGLVDRRVFCRERWEFSKRLPEIIRGLHPKFCLMGNAKDMIFRQEDKPHQQSDHGWYICVKLGASDKHKNLTLSIRSVHYRTNRPHNTKGGQKRFYALLSTFYSEERQKRDWL